MTLSLMPCDIATCATDTPGSSHWARTVALNCAPSRRHVLQLLLVIVSTLRGHDHSGPAAALQNPARSQAPRRRVRVCWTRTVFSTSRVGESQGVDIPTGGVCTAAYRWHTKDMATKRGDGQHKMHAVDRKRQELSQTTSEVLPAYVADDGPLTARDLAVLRGFAKPDLPKGKTLAGKSLF
jgi:hypothetical protein